MIGLTPRQHECLNFIAGYQAREGGVSPSFEEIGAALGTTSSSSVARLLDGLEERRRIRRMHSRARAIEILQQPAIFIKGEHYRFIPVGAR